MISCKYCHHKPRYHSLLMNFISFVFYLYKDNHHITITILSELSIGSLKTLRSSFDLESYDTLFQVSTVDDSLSVILEQMYTETNLYRKKALFGFINKIIHIHGIHCVKRTMFLTVICDNLDICSNSAVKEILLSEVLEVSVQMYF